MASKEEPSEEEKPKNLLGSNQEGTEESKEISKTDSNDASTGIDVIVLDSTDSDGGNKDASKTDSSDNDSNANNSESADRSSPHAGHDIRVSENMGLDEGSKGASKIDSSDNKNSNDGNSECTDQSPPHAGHDIRVSDSMDANEGSKGASKIDSSDCKNCNDDKSECTDQSSPRAILDVAVSSSTDSDGGGRSSEISSAEQSVESNLSLQWRSMISGLILRKKKSMIRVVTFPPRSKSMGFRRCLERIRSVKGRMQCNVIAPEILPTIGKWRPSWRSFDYEELSAATDGFSPENLIGKGGHAEVYKGRLADGQLVAVKRLTKGGNKEDRVGDFLSELGIIAHVNHPNAAQLLGFSVEGGLHLVLQFSPHGSLASVLHGSKEGLEWNVRFRIVVGIAEGLLYLHEGCHRRIIHRDIKASNILLTEDYQAQISDFGLAKWLPDKWPHHIVFPIEGTFGYMAPEYFMHGVINEKTDVFAFGVLLLELVTGRKAVDSSRQSLVIWAKPLLEKNNVKELVDPSLADGYDPEEMARVLAVASMCIHHLANLRPSMNSVVGFLNDEVSIELIGRPKVAKPVLFDACGSEDYTRSSYLDDLNRHKQLALEQ